MSNEIKEARERIRNTLIRQLPRDNKDVKTAQESDIRGYDIVLNLEKLKTDNVKQQIQNILEETNPHLYNSTNYKIDFVKHSVKIGINVHIKLVAKKMS